MTSFLQVADVPVPASFLLASRTHLKKSRALVVVEVSHGAQILTEVINQVADGSEREREAHMYRQGSEQ